jgi:hypothetical protein
MVLITCNCMNGTFQGYVVNVVGKPC